MRREFFIKLYNSMQDNPNVIAITADLGYGGFDNIMNNLPKQFINCGAAEQTMLDTAVGLAQAGKIPICYTITPFYYRAYETIRTYINHESIPIIMIGSGRNDDYKHDGFSHYAGDDRLLFSPFKNITCFWPDTVEEMERRVDEMLETKRPYYLNLKR